MARLLTEGTADFIGCDQEDEQSWAYPKEIAEWPRPLSLEWYRSHPQWATDRLMQWATRPNED